MRAPKWKGNLHTSICRRQHFISFLKQAPHSLSINQELLFRFSICFRFFFLFFHQNPWKTRLISIRHKYQDMWVKESELKEVLEIIHISSFQYFLHPHSFQGLAFQELLCLSFHKALLCFINKSQGEQIF